MSGETEDLKANIRSNIGEGVHACLRKFCDSSASHRAYDAVSDMPGSEWGSVADIVADQIMGAVTQSIRSAREQGRIAGMDSERLRIIGIVSEYVDGATMEAILPAIRSSSQSTTPKGDANEGR